MDTNLNQSYKDQCLVAQDTQSRAYILLSMQQYSKLVAMSSLLDTCTQEHLTVYQRVHVQISR